MRRLDVFASLALVCSVCGQAPSTSPKRGLVYVPSSKNPQDDQFWDSSLSDLTWYYNYGDQPSPTYVNSKLQFVPQLWGAPSTSGDTAFLNSIQSQVGAGRNISFVLGFNEPDMQSNIGGSNIDPTTAAQIWLREIEPLSKLGIKLGSPACSSAPAGITWMQNFLRACSNCTVDFMAVHFYGDFQGLASHIGQYVGTFNRSVWVTEYADAHASLGDAQTFYNESSSFMDRNPNITRYSYFGSFRSDVSNVGGNVAFLTSNGKLTDIGSWYLGGGKTGNIPSSAPGTNVMLSFTSLFITAVAVWSAL